MLALIGDIIMAAGAVAALLLLLPLAALVTRSAPLIAASAGLAGFARALVTGLARCVMWAGLAIALIQLGVVVMRYVFGINFIWLQEIIVWLFALLFLLSAADALIGEAHVRVDIFYRDMSARRKALIDLVGTYLFLFPVAILIVWAAGPYVARAWDVMERSREASGLPGVFLLKSVIPVFAVTIAMAGFVMAERAVATLLGREAAD